MLYAKSLSRDGVCHCNILLWSITSFYNIPVDNLPDSSQVIWTSVLIIKVVSVFPNVDTHERFQTMANRVSTIDFLRDDQLTFFVGRKPYPTRTKEGCTLLLEFLFESIERTKLSINSFSKRTYWFAVCLWCCKLSEIKIVVEKLSCIVENATFSLFYNFF